MKTRRIVFIAILAVITAGCELSEKDVVGTYAAVDYRNSFDTIVIVEGGTYLRRVHDKNNKLLLLHSQKWAIERGKTITLSGFYLNYDDDLLNYPYLVNDTNFSLNAIFNNGFVNKGFCSGRLSGEFCYERVF